MRYVTTVPQQALFFLNSPFVAEQARHVVARREVANASGAESRIEQLYRAVLARSPEPWETEAGVKFVAAAGNGDLREVARSAWQYGTGDGTVFQRFGTYTGDRWQASARLVDPQSGKAVLTPTGGEPGEHSHQSVVRRWVSPVSGRISIDGTLRHGQGAVPYGDGVRGRVVSSRTGELASWSVNGSSAETKLNGIVVEAGDTIDFIVDARNDPENDGFGWSPSVTFGDQIWNARNDFAGPAPEPLDVWARYAQVLLQTNEFAFVD
jgi:hypothetical protein